jgi:hypothetical protein
MTTAVDNVTQRIRDELATIELDVLTQGVTLPDLIRQGSEHSDKCHGWSAGADKLCALSAAEAALRARK